MNFDIDGIAEREQRRRDRLIALQDEVIEELRRRSEPFNGADRLSRDELHERSGPHSGRPSEEAQ